jgi:hypothetical protein
VASDLAIEECALGATTRTGGALFLDWTTGVTTLENSIVAGNVDGAPVAFPAHDLNVSDANFTSGGSDCIGGESASAPVPSRTFP